MPKGEIAPQAVPSFGPLQIGGIYRRRDLNERFGGNTMSGIVPSTTEPVVLLFHTKEPTQQFYGDEFDNNGVYWYSGKGAHGDMPWNHENVAIRDHESNGNDLLFFERIQRKDGLWRFAHIMHCVVIKIERRPDRNGIERNAILFGLVPIESSGDSEHSVIQGSTGGNLYDLRAALVLASGETEVTIQEKVSKVYKRSTLVTEYALLRANGRCEACTMAAPFTTKAGLPYLEVHHLYRLADGGPDRFDRVAAICPNCHRRCHYSIDGGKYNQGLIESIQQREAAFDK